VDRKTVQNAFSSEVNGALQAEKTGTGIHFIQQITPINKDTRKKYYFKVLVKKYGSE
jgi:hypothetical protein